MKKQFSSALLLAAILTASLVSCGDSGDDGQKKGGPSTEPVTAPVTESATEAQMKSLLPQDLDFGGQEVRILNGIYFENDGFMLSAESSTGDIVNDAVYKRYLQVESELNVKLKPETHCLMTSDDSAALLRKSVTAGSNDFDLMFGIQYNIVPEVLNNVLMNLNDTKYLQLDQPWWYQNCIRELSVGAGATYFVTGDITLGVLRNMSCMYVNKNLYQQYFESADEIYQEVLDGKWTFDRMGEICSMLYQDLNGDGKTDDADRFGIGVITASLVDHFTYDAGIRATTRNADNIPEITMNNEQTVNFMQKLYNLYYENPGVRIFEPTYDSLDIVMPNKFQANELLYLPGWFYTSELLRSMDVDYAVIPFPKYDEQQESYLSLVHDVSTVVCVPTTCEIVDTVSAVMEDLAFYGYRDVLPAYYEVAIKVKYNRDSTDEAMQVLDIIHDHSTSDFAYVYNYALNGLGLIGRELMGGKKSEFSSYYEKREKSYQKKMDTLIGVFTDLE